MAFGNTNNENKTKGTSTRGLQFYNATGSESTLVVGYYRSTLSLGIHPALPAEKRTKTSVYNYDTIASVLLTPTKAMDLLEGIYDIENIMEYFEPFGVPAGNGFVEISPLSKVSGESTDKGIMLTIYIGVDGDGAAANSLSYLFNFSRYFKNYNKDGNKYDLSDIKATEFKLFIKALEEFTKAATRAIAHSIRDTNSYSDNFIKSSLSELKEKAGIKSSYSSNGVTSFFNSRAQLNEAPVGEIQEGGTITDRLPI